MSPDDVPTEIDTIYFPNGDYYEGDAYQRMPHGNGTMIYVGDKKERTGYWQYGFPVSSPIPDKKIPGSSEPEKYQPLITVNKHTLRVGFGYDNTSIAETFGVSTFPRGIRIHHDNAVLLSVNNSVYQDGIGWTKDSDGEYIFIYTGEGLSGNQEMSKGNLFLRNSTNGGLYLFVKRKSNDYIFHGEVEVKRIEEATEPDKNGTPRKVFKFVLRRHTVE